MLYFIDQERLKGIERSYEERLESATKKFMHIWNANYQTVDAITPEIFLEEMQ